MNSKEAAVAALEKIRAEALAISNLPTGRWTRDLAASRLVLAEAMASIAGVGHSHVVDGHSYVVDDYCGPREANERCRYGCPGCCAERALIRAAGEETR